MGWRQLPVFETIESNFELFPRIRISESRRLGFQLNRFRRFAL